MDLYALLDALGYLAPTGHWVAPDAADSRLAHHYRLARKAGEDAGPGAAVAGCYAFRTSPDDTLTPPRPAVFVATAQSDNQAREIHKSLWNLGVCPFLLVLLPGSVRVYTGFDYSAADQQRAVIADEPLERFSDGLPLELQPFHAAAIDSGRIWGHEANYLRSATRVDCKLLNDLTELGRLLLDRFQLSPKVAHALIGKYLYFRYLRDRRILNDGWLEEECIKQHEVFGSNATSTGFDRLADALQRRFNGDVFPLPNDDDGRWRGNGTVAFLAGVFYGNSPTGQLAMDFNAYNFSFIPVELLSSIYEQFLKAEGRGGSDGIVYTPEPLADYVLAELEAVRPLGLGDRVLDPCCGSGVFLVLAFRRLIERAWRAMGARPSADEMKQILQGSIFGVEVDEDACSITAFSLLITLLSYIDPPELNANSGFQFPTLVGENIYHMDFFASDSLVPGTTGKFDWIVGNPPWTSADRSNPEHKPALNWIASAIRRGCKVGQCRLDQAFAWRASGMLREGGHVGLLISAMTLVNSKAQEFRKSFFRAHEVRRVTNFSNLRRIPFMGPEQQRTEAPAASLIYRSVDPEAPKASIVHFGPFVANQIAPPGESGRRRIWTITLYEGDIQEVEHGAAESDDLCPWKIALWGTYQDRRVLRRLDSLLPQTINNIAIERNWTISKGLEIRRRASTDAKSYIPASDLKDQMLLRGRFARDLHVLPQDLVPIRPENAFIRRAGKEARRLMKAPHVVVTARGGAFSDQDFVIPSPKIGIAAEIADCALLRALAVFLTSNLAHYAQFFHSPPAGMYINSVNEETIRAIRCPEFTPSQTAVLAELHSKLAPLWTQDVQEEDLSPQALPFLNQEELDTVVDEVLSVPPMLAMAVREFMQVRYQLAEGKASGKAILPPPEEALRSYAEQLRLQLDDFTRRRHSVIIARDAEAIVATVEVTDQADRVSPQIRSTSIGAGRALAAVKSQHSQWVYVQRSIRVFDGPRVYIIKAARLLDWTRTQAIQDATDLIAEVLDRTAQHAPATA